MATAVFLIIPEAVHLIGGGHSDHDEHEGHGHRILEDAHDHEEGHEDNAEGIASAKFGCGFLGGLLLPILLSIFFHFDQKEDDSGSSLVSNEDECMSCKEAGVPHNVDTGVVVDSSPEYDADDSNPDPEDLEVASPEPIEIQIKTEPIDVRFAATILIGDFFHNYADGLFIGAAFLSCSQATAISIALATIFHEIAQVRIC